MLRMMMTYNRASLGWLRWEDVLNDNGGLVLILYSLVATLVETLLKPNCDLS
jgi:hypothetical protein